MILKLHDFLIVNRYVSGITEKQAKAIIAYRNQNGVFINREELKNVKGVGAVTFKNCAGFVRILPQEKEIKVSSFVIFHCFNPFWPYLTEDQG